MSDETKPRDILVLRLHVVQMVLACVVLGLSAFAVHFVGYSVLVYSVVVVSFVLSMVLDGVWSLAR
jgi:hypothetical protein